MITLAERKAASMKKALKKAAGSPTKRKTTGGKNWGEQEKLDVKPAGANGWDRVAELFDSRAFRTNRNGDQCKNIFRNLLKYRKPTGDPNCPHSVREAKRVQHEIESYNSVIELNDSEESLEETEEGEEDEDEEREDEEQGFDNNSKNMGDWDDQDNDRDGEDDEALHLNRSMQQQEFSPTAATSPRPTSSPTQPSFSQSPRSAPPRLNDFRTNPSPLKRN
ncbi:hypothetical protein BDR26DRAFT_904465 [Obelidium mucronatum]|nr:hypothetical protein BDR26DRAFT_904465 [Obelidium mucronatum]